MEGTEILNIFKIMNKILKVISSEEFHLVDIIKPGNNNLFAILAYIFVVYKI